MLFVAVVTGLQACAGHAGTPRVTAVQCEAGDTVLVRDVIYFGRNRPDGGTVSDAEWQAFLEGVVTPRFPAGLTVVDAAGQWLGKSGAVESERAKVVSVLHPGDGVARRAIEEITAEYKRRFRQEAVLRERASACVRF